MSALLLLFIVSLLVLERWARKQQRYYQSTQRYRPLPKYPLKGLRGFIAMLACFLPIAGEFLIPASGSCSRSVGLELNLTTKLKAINE
jgi:iron(III) transport system permease protein